MCVAAGKEMLMPVFPKTIREIKKKMRMSEYQEEK